MIVWPLLRVSMIRLVVRTAASKRECLENGRFRSQGNVITVHIYYILVINIDYQSTQTSSHWTDDLKTSRVNLRACLSPEDEIFLNWQNVYPLDISSFGKRFLKNNSHKDRQVKFINTCKTCVALIAGKSIKPLSCSANPKLLFADLQQRHFTAYTKQFANTQNTRSWTAYTAYTAYKICKVHQACEQLKKLCWVSWRHVLHPIQHVSTFQWQLNTVLLNHITINAAVAITSVWNKEIREGFEQNPFCHAGYK